MIYKQSEKRKKMVLLVTKAAITTIFADSLCFGNHIKPTGGMNGLENIKNS